MARALADRQFRYSACEFAGLVQKGFSESRLSRFKALALLHQVAQRHPRAALNLRFIRNLVFILLPAPLRRRIIAARSGAAANPA